MRILYFIDWYSPAFKAGGPIRSAEYLMEMGIREFEFFILTSNRDLDGSILEVQTDVWLPLQGSNKVMYLGVEISSSIIRKIISELKPDGFHINGMFSKGYSILPMKVIGELGRWSDVVISPRGMLEPGALEFKKWKKKIFLSSIALLPWAKKVLWHATHTGELNSVQKVFGEGVKGMVVSNPCMKPPMEGNLIPKKKGSLTICHVGRLHPIKGLLVLLEALKSIKANDVVVHIVGPEEDQEYYSRCLKKTAGLDPGIQVNWHGALSPSEVHKIQRLSHAMVLPSQSENFGHAIYENLALGRPVAIGPNTPWKELEDHDIGSVCNLEDVQQWTTAIQRWVNMNEDSFHHMCNKCYTFANDFWEEQQFIKSYSALYNFLIQNAKTANSQV